MASRSSFRFGMVRRGCTSSSSSELDVAVLELDLRTDCIGRLGDGLSFAKAATGMGSLAGEVGPLLRR